MKTIEFQDLDAADLDAVVGGCFHGFEAGPPSYGPSFYPGSRGPAPSLPGGSFADFLGRVLSQIDLYSLKGEAPPAGPAVTPPAGTPPGGGGIGT